MTYSEFPDGFLWGAATSAAQIEGSTAADGRGDSIWDVFCRRNGTVAGNETPAVACDSYARPDEDVAALKQLGVGAYRFSVAWPRVFPSAGAKVNARGLDYYDRLTDKLLEAKIAPYVTLFHWDLPQWLEEQGGWLSRDCAARFVEYASAVAERLGDRVRNYMTFNEIATFVGKGYERGIFAPGKRLSPEGVKQVYHHVLLAHGLAVRALRALVPGASVGLAYDPNSCLPLIEDSSHVAAAEAAFRAINGRLLSALFLGRYPEGEAPLSCVRPGDMETIRAELDFLGLNIYSGAYYVPDAEKGFREEPLPAAYPAAPCAGWLAWCPTALYWTPEFVHKNYFSGPLLITENGYASDSGLHDADRIAYLRQTLGQVRRGIAEGLPLRGYFAWSLLDNFEWTGGYDPKFGLFAVDAETFARKPKSSALFYAAVVKNNRIM